MIPTPTAKAGSRQRWWNLIPLKEERLERRLALAFGLMLCIPLLILVWVMVYQVELGFAIFLVAFSSCIGYFLLARPMIQSVVEITRRIRTLSNRRSVGQIEVNEQSEIGELARSFNRITEELERKIDELESSRQLVKKLLTRIGNAIVSYEGIDTILTLIVENTVGALEAHMGSLLLVDGEKQELSLKTAWSRNGDAANRAYRTKLGEGIAGWVAKEGRAMRGPARAAVLGFTDHDTAGTVLCVPLKLRDQPIGVIGVLREEPMRTFTDDDESLMTSIGSQIAVAIENYRLNLDIEQTYVETIMALALAVEAKDPYSAGHSKRVGYYSRKIGEVMGLDEESLRVLNDAGVLHDIGKIGVKDEILLKPRPLTPDEEKVMQQHSVIGEAIVKPVRSLQKVVALVRHHHERFDGTGYPSNLKGEEIPLGARILSVADTYDSMVTDRPYRKRLTIEDAKAELKKCAGVQHDPAVVEAFLQVITDKEQRRAAAAADQAA